MSGLYPLTRMVILRGFYKVETDFALQNLEQASSAISNELDTLRHSADQYADWDTLLGRDDVRRGPTAALPASAFEQLRINFAVVVDGQGRKILSQGFNLAAMQPAQAPAGSRSITCSRVSPAGRDARRERNPDARERARCW